MKASRPQPSRSFEIGFRSGRVRTSVPLDDPMTFVTDEIGHVRSDRSVAAECMPSEAVSPKDVPAPSLPRPRV
jgi:hypothetical protein